MPLLTPSSAISKKTRLVNKVAAIVLAVVGALVGLWEAYSCAQVQFGYVAGYAYAAALFLGIGASCLGLVMLLYWRTRTIGIGLLASGIFSYGLFLGGMELLSMLDRGAWRHEPPLTLLGGPHQAAAVVIYFRPGTTSEQIENFEISVLRQTAAPGHAGRDFPEFVSTYSQLLPSQANGFDGCSLGFWHNDSSPAKAKYLSKIRSDERVQAVFLNTAPDSIHVEKSTDTRKQIMVASPNDPPTR